MTSLAQKQHHLVVAHTFSYTVSKSEVNRMMVPEIQPFFIHTPVAVAVQTHWQHVNLIYFN